MRALAVEHNAMAARRLVGCLTGLGYRARSVATGGEALRSFTDSDLVLLDLDLPDIDGLDVCRGIRAAGEIPVIAFAPGAGEADRVLGLQAGADDCMGKPYGLRELAARIRAVTRRARTRGPDPRVVGRGALRVDPGIRQVSVGGRPVALTRKEFDLIHLLASNPDRVFSRAELMSRIWQDSSATTRRATRASRTLDTHVGTLRSKIGSDGCIVTVRGIGFRLGTAELTASGELTAGPVS